jgi:hypothetical protein
LAVLNLPKRINVLVTFASGIVKGMTGNASPALAGLRPATPEG